MPRRIEVPEETWDKLRVEYISSSDVSIRGLQKKYGIPYNQIRNRCENEDWLSQRDELRNERTQKSIDLVSTHQAEECTRAFRLANKVMDKLEEVVDAIDPEDDYAIRNLKDATAAIKNLKEIGLFRSALDQAEQEARIEKLRKDAEEEQKESNSIKVVFEGDMDEYFD